MLITNTMSMVIENSNENNDNTTGLKPVGLSLCLDNLHGLHDQHMVKKKVRITRVTGQLEPSCMVIRTNRVAILIRF
jgi:hypothetical protein